MPIFHVALVFSVVQSVCYTLTCDSSVIFKRFLSSQRLRYFSMRVEGFWKKRIPACGRRCSYTSVLFWPIPQLTLLFVSWLWMYRPLVRVLLDIHRMTVSRMWRQGSVSKSSSIKAGLRDSFVFNFGVIRTAFFSSLFPTQFLTLFPTCTCK